MSRKKEVRFNCPNCGNISADSVAFLCNNCQESELIERDGLFICPNCLKEGENFECMICQSKEVQPAKPL
ncbi:MAG: hypothetical protein M1352_01025 [Patescibacteria group bacterium]|nr:hypothetical protein [Patescibacteria group bacterium]